MPTPKKRYLDSTPAITKQRLAKMNRQSNARERNIAKAYLEAGPNIVNLAKAAYHWYNSVPWLGGKDENGNILVTGEVPTPGMRSPKNIVKGVKTITKANEQKTTLLGGLVKPMLTKAALAIKNYRHPFGRPKVSKNVLPIKPQVRTKVGDVEIDNPNLLYHLDRGNSAGAFSNQGAYVEDGILFPGVAKKEGQLGYSWWNKGKPYTTSVKGQPMTRLMTATKDTPGMLQVRSQNYPIGQWTGSKGFVLSSEYVNPEGVNVSESIYALDPTYGWRRVSKNIPTIEWADATKTPIITTENAINITPKQWTAAQDAAIARGDIAEARRLKELYDQTSAKKAALSLYSNLRHDTKSNTWHVFDETKFGSATDDGWFGKGLYLTANPKQIVKGNNHMRLNVFMKKPFLVDKNGDPDRWTVAREFNRGKTYDDWIKENSFSENEIEDLFSGFKDNPFGVSESKKAVHLEKDIAHENKLKKLFDEMNSSDGVIVSTPKVNLDEVVAPNGRFIKSADVVTYDDNGIRIGLGERNNFSINDTRYGLIPIIGGGIGYGLYNKKSNKNKNIR